MNAVNNGQGSGGGMMEELSARLDALVDEVEAALDAADIRGKAEARLKDAATSLITEVVERLETIKDEIAGGADEETTGEAAPLPEATVTPVEEEPEATEEESTGEEEAPDGA